MFGAVPATEVWTARGSLPCAWASLRRCYHGCQEAFVVTGLPTAWLTATESVVTRGMTTNLPGTPGVSR
jgi:hypothetical protein